MGEHSQNTSDAVDGKIKRKITRNMNSRRNAGNWIRGSVNAPLSCVESATGTFVTAAAVSLGFESDIVTLVLVAAIVSVDETAALAGRDTVSAVAKWRTGQSGVSENR